MKHFVLDYRLKIFGKMYNAPRASRIIFPIMVITGYFAVTNPNYPTPTSFVWFLYTLLTIALFFGFVYFRINPVKWEELDDFQKFQYGVFKFDELTKQQQIEYNIICKIMGL